MIGTITKNIKVLKCDNCGKAMCNMEGRPLGYDEDNIDAESNLRTDANRYGWYTGKKRKTEDNCLCRDCLEVTLETAIQRNKGGI